jgi:diaminopimelate decarboxylase
VEGVARTGLTLVLEPGRALVGAAGLLLTRVVDVKEYPGGPRFAILDAGMTELLRPALYNAFHRIVAVVPRAGDPRPYEVVGPLCESSDIFGRDRLLPPLEPGDLLAVLDTGAYGAAMASTYNRRPLPPEVLVNGDDWRVIRRRQTIDDLVALEA